MDESKKRGGPGRGQGRKPIKRGEDTVTVSLRMTPDQRAKLARLGGAGWVRDRIDRARETSSVDAASCEHDFRCINDGKHGREEWWECKLCGVGHFR